MLRSILARLEYLYRVRFYHDEEGVPFRTHAYVPEIHPATGHFFCEREDEEHVFKVCLLQGVHCMHSFISKNSFFQLHHDLHKPLVSFFHSV